ncbi:MAG TPA: hypothetical protein P5194_02065 [Patescibacteria group bacterium]|jgi:hypothetical protein|nr:hypothetical protein [bacterium]HRT11302.1 hypothetical protein [Patescibacteria group bacterium]HRU90073.1 hypothetical protein [Patescibacteria group bacterium]
MSRRKLSEEQIISGESQKLAFLVDSLNISQAAKDLLMEIISMMEPKDITQFAAVLEEKLASEQTAILEIELQNKLEALAIKYMAQEEAINHKSIVEIKKLIEEQKLRNLRQTIK